MTQKQEKLVENILKDIEKTKEDGCKELNKKFDKFDGDIIVTKEKIEEIKKSLDQKTKDDIQFSHERVRKFAEAQLKNYGQDFEVELSDGLCRTETYPSKYCRMLCSSWKICSYSICCYECYNSKSCWCKKYYSM